MGLYDNLGDWQVKCFVKAGVSIIPKNDDFSLNLSSSGGYLRYFRRGTSVPYKTCYYNYGKDFMVFDYRTFNYREPVIHNDDLYVHIIRNGRYFRSVRYDRVPSRYKIGLVLDNYGEVVNIKTHSDFKEIVYGWRHSHTLYDELFKKYREENGVFDILRMDIYELKAKELSKEELHTMFTKHRECMDRASRESLKPFRDTWYEGTEKIDDELNRGWPYGGLYASLEWQSISEFDKYWIARLFVKEVERKKDFQLGMEEYFNWCAENDIEVDQEKFRGFFDKYLQEIPEHILKAYENSEDKKYRDKIYGAKS